MSDETPAAAPSKGLPKWAILLIIIIVVLLIGGYAVQRFAAKKLTEIGIEKAIEMKTGAKVNLDQDKGSFKIQGENGQIEFGSANQWPADMPASVPKVTVGSIQAAMSNNENNVRTWSVVIKDVEQSDVDRYVADLQAAGWKMGTQANVGVAIYQLSKDNFELNLGADPSSKGLTLGLQEVQR